MVGPIVYLTLESKEQLPDEEKKEGCKLYRSASYFFFVIILNLFGKAQPIVVIF